VESAVGIRAGGRTGLTAVVCALLMALGVWLGLYFAPLLALVPAQAAAGVLVYVGYLILSSAVGAKKPFKLLSFDTLVALTMALVSFITFSLDKSLALGLWAYFGLSLVPGRAVKPAWWLAAIAGLLTAAILFSR
jgi:AGZA family xanthine/uracil permease-like MFS transporter